MRQELLEYYEQELSYLRQMGGEFARRFPRVAGRLQLEAGEYGDPHVERLLEGFAFLAARVHRRLDDDLPQLSEALLNLIYPGYLQPIPAMTIVEFTQENAAGKSAANATIRRGTQLDSRGMLDGLTLQFSTSYDVDLWPIAITEGEFRQPERLQSPVRSSSGAQATAALRIRLTATSEQPIGKLPLERLRFHIAAEAAAAHTLYELLSVNLLEVQIQDTVDRKRCITIDSCDLSPVGFGRDENVLPYHRRSVDGYRLLKEYFTLPEKFFFFDLAGLEPLREQGFGKAVDIVFLFSRFERPERQQMLELATDARTLRLGCTPAINLFPLTAEPISVNQTRSAYPVVPHARYEQMMEVVSIDEVLATNPRMRETATLEPMYSFRYATRKQEDRVYWSATRRRSDLGEERPSTMHLSTVDVDGVLRDVEADVLTVRCTCSNFDLPSRMPYGSFEGDFKGVNAAKITMLRRPTRTWPAPCGPGQLWRLISHLSLNYLSLSEEGRPALQEILRLHNFTDSTHLENQIASIRELTIAPHFAMVASDYGLAPVRGLAVQMDLDEQQFTGAGALLFATVLDRFLAAYASINSFAQLTATTTLRKEPLHRWPPRAGTQVLL